MLWITKSFISKPRWPNWLFDDLAIPDEDVNNPLHGEAVSGKVTTYGCA